MNKTTLALSAALVLSAASPASASTGNVSLAGEIVSSGCVISVNGSGTQDGTVQMPSIEAASVTSNPNIGPFHQFSIEVGSPTSPCTNHPAITFYSPYADANQDFILVNTDPLGAQGVGLAMFTRVNLTPQSILFSGAVAQPAPLPLVGGMSSGQYKLDLLATYAQIGPTVTAGNFETSFEYTIVYN